MRDSLLDKYAAERRTDAVTSEPEAQALESCGAFGFLRGIHERAIMVELRYKNGNIEAFPYAWLSRARFDPSDGITLSFGSEIIKLVGRNLNAAGSGQVSLYEAIIRHRAVWIQEADQMALLKADPTAILVEKISIK